MKIAFPIVVASSGSDVYFKRLSEGLQKRGVSSEVIPLDYSYEFVLLKYRRLRSRLSAFDIVHTNSDYGCLFHVPGRPLVATLHHNVFEDYYQRFTTVAQKLYHFGLVKQRVRRTLGLCAAAVCVSRATCESYQRTFPGYEKKLQTIYNGIDAGLFKPLPKQYPAGKGSLLFVGNLSKRKGADLLGPIMDRLGEGFELVCVARPSGLVSPRRNIRIVDRQPLERLPEYYNRAEMLLFPSRLEGFGYAAAEAMACARPVVCGNRSSLPELIDAGQGGYLCDPENPGDFVRRVREISGSPGSALAMGLHNREKVEQLFTVERMVEQYLELYKSLI